MSGQTLQASSKQLSLLGSEELETMLNPPVSAHLRRLRLGVRLLLLGGALALLIFVALAAAVSTGFIPTAKPFQGVEILVLGASAMGVLGCWVVRLEFKDDIRAIQRHL